MTSASYEELVQDRIVHEKLATQFIKAINDLWYDKGIEMLLFRNQLIDKRPSEILSLHNYARKFVGKPIKIEDTTSLLENMLSLDLCPARMDIGRLASEWLEGNFTRGNEKTFLEEKLKDFIGPENNIPIRPKDVVLYGFGRIGRLLARELIAQEGRGEQLRLRASKVLLTAPGKGVPNIVHGVNQTMHNPKDAAIFSAASCTTNAIVPVLKVINDALGIEKGHIETVHAYTNDQNLVDNMHSKYRRGRSAATNMVITETGAGSAIEKAIPGLGPKFTSNAIRVPVPDGSLAILNLQVNKKTSLDEVNEIMRKAALEGDLVEQINYSISNELVSSDIIGNSCPSIYDSKATQVHPDGMSVILYVWYDNEYGYTRQVMRLSKYIAQVQRKRYY
jgi:glyceraldehyde-3-phosphate dehydrogenase/erythrose-4-phosphate dehydrogenase